MFVSALRMSDAPACPSRDGAFAPAACLLAAGTLGHALAIRNGRAEGGALGYLTIAIALVALAVLLPRRGDGAAVQRSTSLAAGVVLAASFVELFTTLPTGNVQAGSWPMLWFNGVSAVAAVLAGGLLTPRPLLGRLHFPALVLTFVYLGAFVLHNSPAPHIDVFTFHKDSLYTLVRGQNPYTLTFPNIYGHAAFYGPGLSVNGRVQFGFPYPPLTLLLDVPGYLFGDFRHANLIAMAAAALLMAHARPNGLGPLAAAVYLFTPRSFFVLDQSWTEPMIVLLLAGLVFAACRVPRLVPVLFGLFLSAKQYLIVAVPLGIKLLGDRGLRPVLRFFVIAALAALVVTLPLALWNPAAFWKDVVVLHFLQPFRAESLAYLSLLTAPGHAPPLYLGAIAWLVGVALVLWRAPRTPMGFALAVAFVLTLFFAFSKQAFANYYFLIIGALATATASADSA